MSILILIAKSIKSTQVIDADRDKYKLQREREERLVAERTAATAKAMAEVERDREKARERKLAARGEWDAEKDENTTQRDSGSDYRKEG
jgi:hypothetical protein